MDLGVKDKVFAIVGGTGGMGLEAARMLAREGAKVALVGRGKERGEARARALSEEAKADVRMFLGDGTEKGAVEAAIESVAKGFGRLDGLAVTAGPMLSQAGFADLTDEDWDGYFQTQLMMTVRACRAALPHIVKAGGGTIVNTSAYSIRAQKPTLAAYTAMKTAVASVTKNIAVNYGDRGVRANTVCPGFIFTEAANDLADMCAKKYNLPPFEALSKSMLEDWGMKVALGRVGRPEELGELIAFLLSARAGYLSGALINCDGGTQF